MIPGKVNKFQVVPTQTGDFQGKCAELCGAYHSQMLFNVKVVEQAEYDAHIAELKAKGNEGQLDNGLNREQVMDEDNDLIPGTQGATDHDCGQRVDLPAQHRDGVAPADRPGATVVKWMTTTDHKVIGNLYFITSFVFFMIGGLLALLIRAELFNPGLQVVDNPEQFNQLFTMHGTIMLLLFATPLFAGSPTRSCRSRSARPTWRSRA